MKHLCIFISILLVLSCKKEQNESSIKNIGLKAKIVSGNNQLGLINQELDSTIKITVSDIKGDPYKKAKLVFNTTNGKMMQDDSNLYAVHWFLDCNVGIQNASIIVYDSIDRLIDTLKISSYAKKDSIWNRACGFPLRIQDSRFIFPTIQKIIEHPNGTIYLTTYSYSEGMYASIDNGVTWNEQFSFNKFSRVHDISINENGTFFLSTDSGLFMSNESMQWKKILNERIDKCFVLDNQTLFACAGRYYIYRSNDEGETWNKISIPYINRYGFLQYAEYIKNILRLDSNQILLLNDEKDLLISKDNGTTWEILSKTNTFWDISGFFLKDGNIFLVNIDGAESIPKVYKSSLNNISWSIFCTLTHRPGNYYEVSEIFSYENYLYFLTDNCIYKVDENGNSVNITKNVWNKINDISKFLISKNGYIIIGSEYKDKGVFYSKINMP